MVPTSLISATNEEQIPLHVEEIKQNNRYESTTVTTNLKNPPPSLNHHHPWSIPTTTKTKTKNNNNTKKKISKSKNLWAKTRGHINSIIVEGQDEIIKELHEEVHDDTTAAILGFSAYECVIPIIVYLILGTMAYSFLFEKWDIVDSLYFSVVTFTTVGYGDIAPSTTAGKIFTCVFATLGVAYLGFLLGIIGHNIIEAKMINIDTARLKKNASMIKLFDRKESSTSTSNRSLLHNDTSSSPWDTSLRIAKYITIYSILILGATYIGFNQDQWGIIDSLYYIIVTSLTIGYGDTTPDLIQTKLFAIIYIPFAVGTVGTLVGGVASWVIEKKMGRFLKTLESRRLTMDDLAMMDSDGDGKVTRLDFIEFLLVMTEKVDRKFLDRLHQLFDEYDELGNNVLSKEDLKAHVSKELKCVSQKLKLSNYKKRVLRAGTYPGYHYAEKNSELIHPTHSV